MDKAKFKEGQKIRVNSAFSPSLLGHVAKKPKYNENAGEFEYLIQTEKHTALGELGKMYFLESELFPIEN